MQPRHQLWLGVIGISALIALGLFLAGASLKMIAAFFVIYGSITLLFWERD